MTVERFWKILIWSLLGIVLVAILLRAAFTPPPVPGGTLLDDFQLTDQQGCPFTPDDLRGKVTVINFIFTRCSGPCPLMTSTLRRLQEELPRDVRFVSFTVDPEFDTPAVLQEYARLYDADLSRWRFVTGDKKTIYGLAHQLHLVTQQDSKNQFIHSSRYLLVDHHGVSRSSFVVVTESLTVDAERKSALTAEVERLLRGGLPFPLRFLPTLNASLNGFSVLLLTAGFLFIRRKNIAAHRTCMVTALCVSLLFLASYLYYHAHVGTTRYAGPDWFRTIYFIILFSHTILAATVPPLAVTTVVFAATGRIERHRKIARWTLPIWLYVSATGVLIYVLLYHLLPRS